MMRNILPMVSAERSRNQLFKNVLSCVLLCLLSLSVAQAQTRVIEGTVVDENTEPIPGVNVLVKGTDQGTITDIEGQYRVNVSENDEALLFSYVGYETREVPIETQSIIDVDMTVDAAQLSEVVVTALGIKRETRALGYAVQEVQGEEINEAREVNVVNSLAGKVAGVQITNGSSGPGSSSRIIIRGETSLAGNNQPLFIVDGIPINNNTDTRTNSSGLAGNMEMDYGNGAADINPDDVESITVLKGANATALYGSRAAGGAIVITTKSGRNTKGIGVSINSTTTFETVLASPEYQRVYGQGKNEEFSFADGFGSGTFDGVDESWGPRMDGRPIAQYDGPTANGVRGGDVHDPSNYIFGPKGVNLDKRGAITPTPWMDYGDPVDQFFETGRTLTNNVAVYGGNETGDFRFSYTNLDNKGITPNTDLRRNNFSLSLNQNLTDKLKISAKANYIKTNSDHRHTNSYGTESIMYLFTWLGQQLNMATLEDYWQTGLEGRQQFNYNYNYHDNPYFNMYENTNGLDKNRFIGNVQMTYNFTPALSLMVRGGTDYFNELRQLRRAFSTQRFPRGQYREDKVNFRETNIDFLMSYNNNLTEDLYLSFSVGGNRMEQRNHFNAVANNQLVIPEVYTFSNTDIPLVQFLDRPTKQINSLYGFGQLGWKNMLFLDFTGRNDWSSTLPSNNNSYFYPSVTASAVLTDLLDVSSSSALSFAKVRAGWAQVGNDTDPYSLQSSFQFGQPWGSNLVARESNTLPNNELKPEIQTSYEFGTDLRFFNNRLGIDATYYFNSSENQIIRIGLPYTSGYTQRVINAGEITNRGIELMLSATPVTLANGFEWRTFVNFTRNVNRIESLGADLGDEGTYEISNNRVTLLASPGGSMGDMYGTGFILVEDANDPNFGRLIYREGLPQASNDLRLLGNYNPDFMIGFTNELNYKNLSFSFLLDWRQGGELMSLTRLIAATSGNVVETLWGRDVEFGGPHPGIADSGLPRTDSEGRTFNDGIIGDGVMEDADGNLVENDVVVAASAYHNKRYKRGNESEGMYDASYVKLREVRFGYKLPTRWFDNNFVQSAKISFVGRNLLLFTDFNHGDPELLSFTGGGQIVPGVEDMALPSTRSMGFNIQINF